MRILNKINKRAKSAKDTGFGTQANSYGGRFLNKNGNANIQKIGIGFFESLSWFHVMLKIPRWKFFLIVLLFYFFMNLFFASIYTLIGVEHLNGINATTTWGKFGQAFFFSVQTFTTVGYGHINPTGFITSVVSSVEALLGLLSFAIATGLFYGRFSKPKAYLKFSQNALIAPYKNGMALMFRLVPFKNTNLTDAEVRVTLGLSTEENGIVTNKFYNLDLEIEKINLLTLSWTLVHPITEDSPLFGMNDKDFADNYGEIMVFFKAFDDMYSTTVVKRTSYTFIEVVYNAKFVPIFKRNNDDTKTIIDISKLNVFEKVLF